MNTLKQPKVILTVVIGTVLAIRYISASSSDEAIIPEQLNFVAGEKQALRKVDIEKVAEDETSFCSEGNGWSIAFEDNFDGDTLDESIWNVEESEAWSSNSYCGSAACKKENVYIEDGHLVILSSADREETWWNNIASGAVTTWGKAMWNPSATTFRVCIRASLPGYSNEYGGTGHGIWPAYLMKPDDASCTPDEGMMNIMEMVDGDGIAHSTYHWQNTYPAETCTFPNGHLQASVQSNMQKDGKDDKYWGYQMHEYAVERSATSIVFATDNVISLDSTNPDQWPNRGHGEDTSNPLFWDANWFLILNTAVGGGWPKKVDESTAFPTYHRIDSVKVMVKD